MKDMKKIIPIAGIAVFCLLICLLIISRFTLGNGINFTLILNFLDLQSCFVVIVGGGALALAKMPKNTNDFLKYFSKTSLLFGVIASMIEVVNMLVRMDDPDSWMSHMSMLLIKFFYGLVFSGISYALSRDTKE